MGGLACLTVKLLALVQSRYSIMYCRWVTLYREKPKDKEEEKLVSLQVVCCDYGAVLASGFVPFAIVKCGGGRR